jgi:hypothetical protein
MAVYDPICSKFSRIMELVGPRVHGLFSLLRPLGVVTLLCAICRGRSLLFVTNNSFSPSADCDNKHPY